MDKIKVLIVEDQLLIAEDLRVKLSKHNFEVTDIVDSGEDALKFLKSSVPDLILMDIQLAGDLDGITTAERILENKSIPIIYLSDHVDEETVNRAKRTNPAAYLSKPFNSGDLLRALEIAFYNASQQKNATKSKLADRILIRTDNQAAEVVRYVDILFLEAARAYCHIQTKEKKYLLSNSMKVVFEQFNNPDFLKVHRGYIVNINHVTAIEGNVLKIGEHSVQMSQEYRDELLSKISLVK